jgi:tripartite ATP-independent transporter DctP family solute receptor
MRRLWIGLCGLVLATTVAVPPAGAQVVLRAGHIAPKDSGEGIAADRFAELVRLKTNGAVTIEVFPSEQLGKAVTQIDSTIVGNQDIYIGGNVEFERFSPALRVLGLNYAIPSQEQFRKILRSPLWQEIFVDPLDKVGLAVLASDWERGPYRVLVSTRPVRSFDDLRGLKLRIAPLDTWRRSWTALGAQVVVLAWTDVYLALKQGLVEAVTSPIDLVWPMKFTEVAKYVTRTDEYWGLLTVVMNKRKFQELKPDHRRALADAAAQAGREYMDRARKQVAWDMVRMKREHGVQFITMDLRPGIERMRPVIAELEREGFIPPGLYARLQAVR